MFPFLSLLSLPRRFVFGFDSICEKHYYAISCPHCHHSRTRVVSTCVSLFPKFLTPVIGPTNWKCPGIKKRKKEDKVGTVVDQSLKVSRDKVQENQSVAHVLNCDNFHQISGIIIKNQPKRRLQYLCHFVVVVVVKIFVVVIVLVIAVVAVYCAILTAVATATL